MKGQARHERRSDWRQQKEAARRQGEGVAILLQRKRLEEGRPRKDDDLTLHFGAPTWPDDADEE